MEYNVQCVVISLSTKLLAFSMNDFILDNPWLQHQTLQLTFKQMVFSQHAGFPASGF